MFDLALSGLGVVALGGLLWPAVAFVLPARRRGGGTERVSAGNEGDWAVGDVRKVSFRGKAVVVLRGEKGFRAFSAVCTHLGCIVHWEKSKRHFACPCHAATFDAEGKVVAGPPPKALAEYGVMVVQGEVIVKDLLES
ncbi:MAG: ubiquinol-cytochrome c reductase iron-sulfur subunit [Planctomycetes bacterium]|nr:ubiquinol-cytochrome c reductase iron-sulfur subunit [Planctomycetota bacterium]